MPTNTRARCRKARRKVVFEKLFASLMTDSSEQQPARGQARGAKRKQAKLDQKKAQELSSLCGMSVERIKEISMMIRNYQLHLSPVRSTAAMALTNVHARMIGQSMLPSTGYVLESTPNLKHIPSRAPLVDIDEISNIEQSSELASGPSASAIEEQIMRFRREIGYVGTGSPIGAHSVLTLPIKPGQQSPLTDVVGDNSVCAGSSPCINTAGRSSDRLLSPIINNEKIIEDAQVLSKGSKEVQREESSSVLFPSYTPLAGRVPLESDINLLTDKMEALQTDETAENAGTQIKVVQSVERNYSEVNQPRRSRQLQSMVSVQTTEMDIDHAQKAYETMLEICKQETPLPWGKVFSERQMSSVEKVGEGTYAEIFTLVIKNQRTCMKVIPVGGAVCVNNEPQKSFMEVLPEVLISTELSQIRYGTDQWVSPNLLTMTNICCVFGSYPPEMLNAWDAYGKQFESLNERPDKFDCGQHFVILLMEYGGLDLERFELTSVKQSVSIAKQVGVTLGILERKFQFEHRDLHIGNILVKPTDQPLLEYKANGRSLVVQSEGVVVYIIDFTLSRLHQNGYVIFNDLSTDPEIFQGQGDIQFDVYRKMNDLLGSDWQRFEPATNLLWLEYLLSKLAGLKYGRRKLPKVQKKRLQSLRMVSKKRRGCADLLDAAAQFADAQS